MPTDTKIAYLTEKETTDLNNLVISSNKTLSEINEGSTKKLIITASVENNLWNEFREGPVRNFISITVNNYIGRECRTYDEASAFINGFVSCAIINS